MGAVLLLSLSLGLAVYGAVLSLPRFSGRTGMIRRLGPRPLPAGAEGRLGRWLLQVPITRRLSPLRFRQLQTALAGSAALLLGMPWLLFGEDVSLLPLALCPSALWAAPEVWLWLQVRRRKVLLARAYPDLLAHLAAQTRAGAGTLHAFTSSPPVLREPLRGEVEELIADLLVAPFPAALQRFADRCGIPAIRTFAQNVIHQQALGISLPDVLAKEEAHTLAMAKQALRQRIQASGIVMAAVTVVLLLNGLAIYFTPVLTDLFKLIAAP